MRTHEERPNSVDNAAIDRLIDGELSDAERREILLLIENEPEGWRRCALAFLEDQAFRKALAGVASAGEKVKHLASDSLAPPRTRNRNLWLRHVPIAASLIALTFAAGFAAGGLTTPTPGPEIARSKAPEPSIHKPETPPKPADESIREVGTIDLVDGSSGEGAVQRIPIYSGPGLDDRWLKSQPSTVPEYVRTRWEREGYQVKESRKVVSVILDDGRKVSIPVDEVALDFVGQNPL
jgi:hypothetical protein